MEVYWRPGWMTREERRSTRNETEERKEKARSAVVPLDLCAFNCPVFIHSIASTRAVIPGAVHLP